MAANIPGSEFKIATEGGPTFIAANTTERPTYITIHGQRLRLSFSTSKRLTEIRAQSQTKDAGNINTELSWAPPLGNNSPLKSISGEIITLCIKENINHICTNTRIACYLKENHFYQHVKYVELPAKLRNFNH